MIKCFVVLIVLVSCGSAGLNFDILSESATELEYSISVESYRITHLDTLDTTYGQLSLDGAFYTDVYNHPSYPFFCKLLLAPKTSTVSLSVDTVSWMVTERLTLAPAQYMLGEFVEHLEAGEDPFWKPGVFLGSPYEFDTYQVVPMYVFPFSYSNNILSEIDLCEVSVNISPVTQFNLPNSIEEVCTTTFFNYSSIADYITFDDPSDYWYLVIYTYDPMGEQAPPENLKAYKDALEPLMDYREELGFNILWAYISPTDTYTNVQNVINYYMDNPNYNVRYIILLGDVVPSVELIDPEWNVPIDSDTYYIWPYKWEIPGIGIGRFPGGPIQIETLVGKILEYEEYYDYSDLGNLHCNEIALLACEDGNDIYKQNCEYVATNDYTCDLSFTKYYRDNGPIQSSNIYSTIENDIGAVSYRGHGGISYYAWDVPGFRTNSNISGLSNPFYPVVFNIACYTGHYTSNCLAEAWLNDTNGGSCGVYAADYKSFTNPNHCLHEYIYQYNYNRTYPSVPPSVGRNVLHANLKTCMIFYFSSTACSNFFQYKWFGDPGLRLWTEESAQERLGLSHEILLDCGLPSDTNQPSSLLEMGSVNPNPARGHVNFPVTLSSSGRFEMTIYDTAGRVIATVYSGDIEAGNHCLTWDSSNVPKGIYMIQLIGPTGSVTTNRIVVCE